MILLLNLLTRALPKVLLTRSETTSLHRAKTKEKAKFVFDTCRIDLFLIVTARIRRMGQGNVFSLFASGEGGGNPVRFPVPSPESSPRPFLGGTPLSSPMFLPGVPQSLAPFPFWWGIPVRAEGSPVLARGVPTRTGYTAGGAPRAVSCRRTFLFFDLFNFA